MQSVNVINQYYQDWLVESKTITTVGQVAIIYTVYPIYHTPLVYKHRHRYVCLSYIEELKAFSKKKNPHTLAYSLKLCHVGILTSLFYLHIQAQANYPD